MTAASLKSTSILLPSSRFSQMVNGVFGKHGRVREAQLVAVEELVCHVAEGANSFVARIGGVIEALFQLVFAFLFRSPCNGFGRAFARLLDAPSRKPELVPPDITSTEETHDSPLTRSGLQSGTDRPYVQEHSLRATLGGALYRNET